MTNREVCGIIYTSSEREEKQMTTIYLIKMRSTLIGVANSVAYSTLEAAEKALANCRQWEDEDHQYEIEEITLILK